MKNDLKFLDYYVVLNDFIMKYGIITHYDVHNHGAILQLNALKNVLKRNFDIDAKALQFDKNYDFMGHALKAKYEISIKSVGIYIKYLQEHGIKCMLFNFKKKRLLDGFKSQKQLIGEYYTECGELDGVVIGSDEVFALHTGPTPVFFGHACPSGNVFSYAGSFGPTVIADIDRLHCRSFVTSGLTAMKGLSMRDQNSLKIASELTNRDVKLVCDPVILYGYEYEIKNLPENNLPPYMLVYAYDQNMNDPAEVEKIKDYAKRNGLKIVSPGFWHSWADYNINVAPIELLGYFKHAKCVVTDTFHGSVMSIITGKELAVKLRGNANKLLNLLDEYGLKNRVIDDFFNLDAIFTNHVDYNHVNSEISRRRTESMRYLTKMIDK